jgi:hypothetical protein
VSIVHKGEMIIWLKISVIWLIVIL